MERKGTRNSLVRRKERKAVTGRSLFGQKCGDMIEPNPIKILMRWYPVQST
jgi:hypothetical protein